MSKHFSHTNFNLFSHVTILFALFFFSHIQVHAQNDFCASATAITCGTTVTGTTTATGNDIAPDCGTS